MDCSTNDPEAGYATAAAAVVSLGLSLAACATVAAATFELRRARAGFVRAQVEEALDGAHALAAAQLVGSANLGRLRWSMQTPRGRVEVLAEPEAAKLSLRRAGEDDRALRMLGVADPDRARGAVRAARLEAPRAAWARLPGLHTAPFWRACVLSVMSPYGQAAELALDAAEQPRAGSGTWRPGELWRIRVVAADGWSDDRIVRFTGRPAEPAAVVDRRVSRGERWGEECASLTGR